MKYQFTTEGTTTQMQWYGCSFQDETAKDTIKPTLFWLNVYCPLSFGEMLEISHCRIKMVNKDLNIGVHKGKHSGAPEVDLDTYFRIISNVNSKRAITVDGKKYYVDVDGLEKLIDDSNLLKRQER